ncbi:hypothetical protein [Brevundimonas sp.]|uniref:hypothetical protein n=1 Tax=Brevundimonas sp. TaxID=1871086 RepID=UPI002D42C43A|nr:hypothetical protein [Brevundimonas sp.]HYC66670.1 hypothetical protein [Brevundimonas sp.]
MTDAKQFVRDHGGPKAVALATDRKPGAVSLWVNRNKLPRDAWPEIMKAFPAMTLDVLLAMEAANDAAPATANAA